MEIWYAIIGQWYENPTSCRANASFGIARDVGAYVRASSAYACHPRAWLAAHVGISRGNRPLLRPNDIEKCGGAVCGV